MITLRVPQQAAYDTIQQHDRGIIKMFCGTGKTRVIFKVIIAAALPISLIVFPRIALVDQFRRDYVNAWTHDLVPIYICSKTEVSHTDFTTDEDTITEFLMNESSNKLVCCTYQSLPTLIDALELCETSIDLAIYDEAHHCVAPATYDLLTYGPLAEADRSYFFTATPNEKMEEDEDEIFGPILFTYTHREAVEDRICNDFEIICRFALPGEYNIYEHIAAAYARTPNGRILVFHSFAEAEVEGRTSVAQFTGAAARRQCLAAFKSKEPTLAAVIAKTKIKDAILAAFEATSDDAISILHNCSILGEGIDTKAANAVVFADPKASTTAIIQNIGRATRLPEGVVRPASIIIPVTVDITKFQDLVTAEDRHKVLCDEFTKGGFQAIQNVLAALRQEDEEIMDAILRSPTKYTRSEVERTFRKAGYEPTGEAATIGELCGLRPEATVEEAAAAIGRPLEVHSDDMDEPIATVGAGENPLKVMHVDETWTKMEGSEAPVEAPRRPMRVRYDISEKLGILWDTATAVDEIGAATLKCTLGSDNWEERRQEWIAMYEKLGRYPQKNKADNEETKVAFWQFNQRSCYKRGASHMTTERINILNSTPGWIWEVEDTWEPNRQYWIAMYQKCGKSPSSNSKDAYEKKAGSWQLMIRQAVKNGKAYMTEERIAILDATEGWTWESNDTWEPNRQHWIAMYHKYDKLPSSTSKIPEVKKAGCWQLMIRQAVKNGKAYMTEERIAILDATEGWIWDMDDAWNIRHALFVSFYKNNKRTPVQTSEDENEKRTAQWQYQQRQHYKKNIITQERINILNKTEGWIWEVDDTWEPNRQHYIKIYKQLGRVPSNKSSDPEIHQAGIWKTNQQAAYSKGKMPQERIDILNETEGWVWEMKDSNWEQRRQSWIAMYNKLGTFPSDKSDDSEEKKAGQWQSDQRKRRKQDKMTQDRIDILNVTEGWKWSEKDDTSSISSAENTIVQPRRRKFKLPASTTEEPSGKYQAISKIGAYHKRFHNLNSATYYDDIRANPTTFRDYHAIADSLDGQDAPEQQVMNRIAALCAKLPPKCRVVDLGCGMNRLRTLVPNCNWTSVDAVAVDETVQVADIAALPFEDNHFQAAVLSRALWGRDHVKQLAEAFRVLNYGAPLFICESRRRWTSPAGTNQLLEDLKTAGFHIKVEPETNNEVFQYIVAQKPTLI